MSDLKDDLQTIDGVGEKTAEKIMDVVADHDTGVTDELIAKALEEAEAGYYRQAAIYLKRSDVGE